MYKTYFVFTRIPHYNNFLNYLTLCNQNLIRETLNRFLYLNEVIPLCIYIFTLLLYIAINTTILEYNTNATCFDLQ